MEGGEGGKAAEACRGAGRLGSLFRRASPPPARGFPPLPHASPISASNHRFYQRHTPLSSSCPSLAPHHHHPPTPRSPPLSLSREQQHHQRNPVMMATMKLSALVLLLAAAVPGGECVSAPSPRARE
jgi:hypothetical protein